MDLFKSLKAWAPLKFKKKTLLKEAVAVISNAKDLLCPNISNNNCNKI
jgi:hypothetical protein